MTDLRLVLEPADAEHPPLPAGRAEFAAAVRAVAHARGCSQTRAALRRASAVADAWADQLVEPSHLTTLDHGLENALVAVFGVP